MEHSKILRERINAIAVKTFEEDFEAEFDQDKIDRWNSHWFSVSEIFFENLVREGLTKEADIVRTIIIDQLRIVTKGF